MESIIKQDDKYAVVFNVNLLRATLNEAKEFKDYLEEAIKETDKEIIVNLSECEHMDSTFLGVLVSGYKKLKKKNRNLMLIEPKTQSSIFLTLDTIGKIFPLYNNVTDALQDVENKKLLEIELQSLDNPIENTEEEIKENSIPVTSSPFKETIEMPVTELAETTLVAKSKKAELKVDKNTEYPLSSIDLHPLEEDVIVEEKVKSGLTEDVINSNINQISFNEIFSLHSNSDKESVNETVEVNSKSLTQEDKSRKESVEWKFGFEQNRAKDKV